MLLDETKTTTKKVGGVQWSSWRTKAQQQPKSYRGHEMGETWGFLKRHRKLVGFGSTPAWWYLRDPHSSGGREGREGGGGWGSEGGVLGEGWGTQRERERGWGGGGIQGASAEVPPPSDLWAGTHHGVHSQILLLRVTFCSSILHSSWWRVRQSYQGKDRGKNRL